MADLVRRIRYWLTAQGQRAELDEEMRLHQTLRAERLAAAGMNPDEAERESRRRFGNRLRLHEESRERWVGQRLDDLGRDVRIGWRGLRRNPGFTLVVVATLALGTGANGAIFRLYDVLELRSVPVPRPDEIFHVQLADRKGWRGSESLSWPALTNLQWEYFRDHQDVFAGATAWAPNTFGLGDEARPVRGVFVSGSFFDVLGVRPELGRVFRAEEDRRGCGVPGAVLDHGFWQREFGGDASLIGRTIVVNHVAVPVVGVTEPRFTGLEVGNRFDVAVPICSQATLWPAGNWLDEGAVWWLTVIGRNAGGKSPEAIDAGMQSLSPSLFSATLTAGYPRENHADYLAMRLKATKASGGVSALRDRYANSLYLLLGATGLVLLLMSANLGNMVLARSSARAHEFGLRLSIGASRSGLMRQLVVENALLAIAGSVLGFFLAGVLSRLLVASLSTLDGTPFLDLKPNGAWLLHALLVAAACVLVFGLLPAWRVSQTEPGDALKGTARVTAAQSATALRKLLVVSQVALSLILVFGALLFAGTLRNVTAVDVGFRRDGIVTSRIDYSRLDRPVADRQEIRRGLLEAIRATPGIVAAGETNVIPLSGNGGGSALWKEGDDPSAAISSNSQAVGPGYLEALGIPILAGRDFDRRDVVGSPPVAIINESLARKLDLGPMPVGQRFRKEANPWQSETTYEVIGLIGDTKYASVKDGFEPTAYYATTQDADPGPFVRHVIRGQGDGTQAAGALRITLQTRYPALNTDLRLLETTIDDGLLREQLLATVSGILGALAALIAAVGLYGVIAYLVQRRTNEIGIRMALGATTGDIVQAVLSQTIGLVAWGIVIGVAGGLAAGHAARSLLYGLAPSDLPTLGAAGLLLIGVAGAAAWLPVRRATRLDAVTALRRD